MARRNIGNEAFIDHDPESGGILKGAGKVSGVRNWTIRLGETDKDTRKSGRAPVTMLPASTAIINVYQLYDKIKLGGKKDVTKKGKKSRQRVVGPEGGVYGWGLPAVREENGVPLNERGYPVSEPGEDKGTFNKRVFAWLNKTGKINKGTKSQFGKKPVEESINVPSESAIRIRNERDEADRKVREMHKTNPRWILWDIVKAKKIRTESTPAYYEQHPDEYTRLDPTDENFERIKGSIANAERGKILVQKKGEPPTIVAIQRTTLQPPTDFYIRSNVLQSRRKKLVRSNVKRSIKNPSHGSGHKVVMKKKGGKR